MPVCTGQKGKGLICDVATGNETPAQVVGYGTEDFSIQKIPRSAAVEMIRANHYSKCVVRNSKIHLGVFLSGEWVGTLQYGYLKNPRTQERIVPGTAVDEYLELNRMWLSEKAPRNSESRAISYSIRFIKAAYPKVKWIQSFADERCGGLGVVYQASNFLYRGEHKTDFYELDGEVFHVMHMAMRDPKYLRPGTRARKLQDNKHRATKNACRQFRYLYFIDRRAVTRLRFPILPYPKPEGWRPGLGKHGVGQME